MKEIRERFNGTVELDVEGIRYGATAELTGYVDVIDVKTIGASLTMDGNTSWDGWISELEGTSLPVVFSKRMKLIFPNGEIRVIVLRNMEGLITGTGVVPF
jgi:hypothetical protein